MIELKLSRDLLRRMREFKGIGNDLESAVGALAVGQVYGWRVVYILHSEKTVARYERVLGVKFREACPEYTPHSRRLVGIRLAEKLEDFWQIVRKKIAGKTVFDAD